VLLVPFGIDSQAPWDQLENACERFHAQIDKLNLLSGCLMKDHPRFIVGGSRFEKNKWQSCINVLILKFQQEINQHLHKGPADLSSCVRGMLAHPFVPIDSKQGESMYYIDSVVLNMIVKLEIRSMKKYTLALQEIRVNVVSTEEEERNDSLQITKVKSIEGVKFVTLTVLSVISFSKLNLSSTLFCLNEHVTLYDIHGVADIGVSSSKENLCFDDFFSES